jgi:serine protease AprX
VCVFDAVQQTIAERSKVSVQEMLQSPFPAYASQETRLIPTPERLCANPRYAGRGITIAFLDSGFYPHPDLTRPSERIRRYVDATESVPVEKPAIKTPQVENWHGTMTSCVGAGNGFMSHGLYRALAFEARVVLIKTGSPHTRRIYDRDIARALDWVIANYARDRVRVINISLGGDRPTTGALTELDQLVEEAAGMGIVVVAASGNGGAQVVHSPAHAPSAITVGGLDDQNTHERSQWRLYPSDYGPGVNDGHKPEVIAPARWLAAPMLLTTATHQEGMFLWQLAQSNDKQFALALEGPVAQEYFKQRTLRLPIAEIRALIRGRMVEQKFIHAHYQHVDGTSFAAPVVASLVAQMLEANPALTPAQVKTILMATANPLHSAPREPQGHGVINAARAVAAALRTPHAPLAGLPFSPDVTAWSVSFIYHDDEAKEVSLVGSFNEWRPQGHSLQRIRPGVWHLTIPPPVPGAYPYKFLVDQSRWTRDPENPAVVEDGYGDYHSLLQI